MPSAGAPSRTRRRAPGGSRGCAGGCRRRRTGSRSRGSRSARRLVLRLLPAPLGPTASTETMSDGSITPAATPGARLRRDGAGVAAGRGDARRADGGAPAACRRRPGARARRTPTARGSRRRRSGPSPRPISRWSAPASITSGVSASASVYWPDCPCGSARNTMSCPASTSGVVSCSVRCASERRCGWCAMSGWPALECAVTVRISTSG